MAERTNIEWADATLNFWEGCTKVSQGCKNCYAENLAKRYGKDHWGPNPRRLVVSTMETLKKIRKRMAAGDVSKNGTKTLMVFVNDISDTFEDCQGKIVHPNGMELFTDDLEMFTQSVLASRTRDGRPLTLDTLREQVFVTAIANPDIVFQVLTKRPENVLRMVPDFWLQEWPPNVWIGTSVEDQKTADERIPHLLNIPAAVRFLSCEPLLGPVDLEKRLGYWFREGCGDHGVAYIKHLDRSIRRYDVDCVRCCEAKPQRDNWIHWVICGGESGNQARPMHPEWSRSLRDQCQSAGVSFFFKQWGEYHPRLQHGAWPDTREGCCDHLSGVHIYADGTPLGTDPKLYRREPYVHLKRVGKKRAGRFLDGREWSEFPGATS